VKDLYVNHDIVGYTVFLRAPGKNIGFIRNDKCGSTYFANIFKANGWLLQNHHDIDWEKDQVFSFIMDPYVRHIKGLVEDAVQMGSEKTMLTQLGVKIWQNLPWLGRHSMPMSVKFGQRINNIEWIPIDIGLESTESIVDSILAHHDIVINWNTPVDKNESTDYEKQLFTQFSNLSNSQEKQILLRSICRDYDIYNKSVSKYQTPSNAPR
jgi:hypothetical protein